jgi:hypothetical protein
MSFIENMSGLEQGLIVGGILVVLFVISQIVQRRSRNKRQ